MVVTFVNFLIKLLAMLVLGGGGVVLAPSVRSKFVLPNKYNIFSLLHRALGLTQIVIAVYSQASCIFMSIVTFSGQFLEITRETNVIYI